MARSNRSQASERKSSRLVFSLVTRAPKPPDFYLQTGLHVEPIASNEELWAIGLVATLWNHIERDIAVIADALTSYDRAAKIQFRAAQTMDNRLRLLRSTIKLKVLPEYTPILLRFVDRIGSMLAQRDKIIHGAWSHRMDEDETRRFIGSAAPNRKPFRWTLSYERIFKVARQMDRLIADILVFQTSLLKPNDRPEAFSHDTLRHTLKEQGPQLPLAQTVDLPTRRKRARQPKS